METVFFLRNLHNLVSEYTASHPERYSSQLPPRKPEIQNSIRVSRSKFGRNIEEIPNNIEEIALACCNDECKSPREYHSEICCFLSSNQHEDRLSCKFRCLNAYGMTTGADMKKPRWCCEVWILKYTNSLDHWQMGRQTEPKRSGLSALITSTWRMQRAAIWYANLPLLDTSENRALYFLTNFSYGELLVPRPTPKLEDHHLSAVSYWLFNIFSATLRLKAEKERHRGDKGPIQQGVRDRIRQGPL
jgi:hypothetical protein